MIGPRIIAPWKIAPEDNCPPDICPPDICLPDNCFRGKLALPRTITPEENCPQENCFLTIKSPSKIIASTQANSSLRVLGVNWGKLSIAYQYYNIRQLQLGGKEWFTSIHILQILTKPCRAPLTREYLSLNASWFLYARTQKKDNIFLEKLIRKRI